MHGTNSFFREFYESFIRVRGVPLTFIALILGFIYFYFSSDTTSVQLKVILPIIVIMLIFIITFYDLSYKLFIKAKHVLPHVIQAHKPPPIYPDAITILLLENSDLYGHESIVSIYYIEEEFEVFIGLGFILTRQDNGYIQVLVTNQIEKTYSEMWQKVCQNDAKILPKLLVKPSLPKGFAEGFVEGVEL